MAQVAARQIGTIEPALHVTMHRYAARTSFARTREMSPATSPSPALVGRNVNTTFGTALPGAAPESAPDPRVAYEFALAAERARGNSPTFPGHRLYWSTSGRFGACDLRAGDEGFLVVGRHTNCDIVLDGDERVSLRHLLLRSVLLDDGCPSLSVLDLSTPLGFALTTGESQRNVSAVGPIVLTIGSYTLVALPNDSLPHSLPVPRSIEGSAHPYRAASPPQAAERGGARGTLVTLMPRLLDVVLDPLPEHGLGSQTNASWDMIARSARGQAMVTLTRDALARGVLIGRGPKCIQPGRLHAVFGARTSRVHALLLETARGLLVFDTASTNGITDARGKPLRFALLDRAPVELGFVTQSTAASGVRPQPDVIVFFRPH